MTAMGRKTSLKKKHSRVCNYYAIIPPYSHSAMLAKYATSGLMRIKDVLKLSLKPQIW